MVSLREIVTRVDPRRIPEDFWPLALARAYRLFRSSRLLGSQFDAAQAAEAAVIFINLPRRSAIADNARPVVEFCRAAIPADIAIRVLSVGGTVQQAEAIRDGDATPSLSCGAL